MSLNIKNERVHSLAREAARLTGRSQTSVIEEALERLLADLGADPATTDLEQRMDVMRQIAIAWSALPVIEGDDRIREIEDLYDEATGLPA